MNNKVLKDILNEYRVDRDFQKEVREGYRNPIQDVLGSLYDTRVHFIYGGSLAKGTANVNSCDIDLLSYVYSDTNLTLKQIYEKTAQALVDKGYYVQKKNSAISITGHFDEGIWDTNVDVVPGRYIATSEDVNLWNNREQKSLKTNPEKQINKVKQSLSKDVIRIIKLFRDRNNFKFKSFFLEIFCIDVIEPLYDESDDLFNKVFHFFKHYNDIGKVKIYDPANTYNDIMKIHNDYEFELIRQKINELYEVLLTDDENSIKCCLLGLDYDISEAYLNNAKSHSAFLNTNNNLISLFRPTINTYYSNDYSYNLQTYQYTTLSDNLNLKFTLFVPDSLAARKVEWVICNAGLEATLAGDLRGDVYTSDEKENVAFGTNYTKFEHTSYHGDHFVQAIVTTKTNNKYYSNLITIKIRK